MVGGEERGDINMQREKKKTEETRTDEKGRRKEKRWMEGWKKRPFSVQVYFVVQIIQNMFQNESYTLITACKSEQWDTLTSVCTVHKDPVHFELTFCPCALSVSLRITAFHQINMMCLFGPTLCFKSHLTPLKKNSIFKREQVDFVRFSDIWVSEEGGSFISKHLSEYSNDTFLWLCVWSHRCVFCVNTQYLSSTPAVETMLCISVVTMNKPIAQPSQCHTIEASSTSHVNDSLQLSVNCCHGNAKWSRGQTSWLKPWWSESLLEFSEQNGSVHRLLQVHLLSLSCVQRRNNLQEITQFPSIFTETWTIRKPQRQLKMAPNLSLKVQNQREKDD